MLKGILFDLDGVITDTAKLHYLAWKEIVTELGVNYTEEENEGLRGLPRKDTLLAILKLKNKDIPSEHIIDDLCYRKNELYKKYLSEELKSDSVLPGIIQFINEAKANNIKLAIASSSYNAPVILKKLGIYDKFDFIVNPADIKKGKPAPDIFIAAAEGLKLQPNECIGIEDSVEGLNSIVSAKIFSVAITNNSNEDFSKADVQLSFTNSLDFNNIKKLFQSSKGTN